MSWWDENAPTMARTDVMPRDPNAGGPPLPPSQYYPGSPYGDRPGGTPGTNTLNPAYAGTPGYGGTMATSGQPPPPAGGPPSSGAPSGGNLQDPAYVDQLIAYYGNQPGADPSLKNDPGYWKQKILSGELGPDQGYIVTKMQTAWKGGPSGGPTGGPGDFSSGNFGGYPTPYQTPTFTAPAPYQAPTFTPPTGLNYTNDPGYLERMKMGTDAIQASAAAKGSVLSGGTLKALERYGQDYGSNEFQNVYGRAANTFGMNANLGLQGYQTNAANAWRGQENQAQYGLAGYQTNVATRRGAEQDYWSRLNNLYQGGLNASQSTYQRPPGF